MIQKDFQNLLFIRFIAAMNKLFITVIVLCTTVRATENNSWLTSAHTDAVLNLRIYFFITTITKIKYEISGLLCTLSFLGISYQ